METVLSILTFLQQTFENEFIVTGSSVLDLPDTRRMHRFGVILDTKTTYTIAVKNPEKFTEYLEWQNATQSTLETIQWMHMDSRSSVRICLLTKTIHIRTLPYSNDFMDELRQLAGPFAVRLQVIDPVAPL